MSLAHGQAITAADIEHIVGSQSSPVEFASLCNAVVWATSGRRCPDLPSFTERVNARDGGIDAEWQVELPPDSASSPLLGPGWNVFQYKQRSVLAAGRQDAVQGIKSSCRGAVREVYLRTGVRPSRYVLLCSADLLHQTKAQGGSEAQKGELRAAVLDGYEWPDEVQVEIVGAAELAALLNDLPHIRSAYFATNQFVTWEAEWRYHHTRSILRRELPTVGRDDEIASLRSCVDDPDVRAVVLCGPPSAGKTRLALEATRHRPADVVVALEPTVSVADLLALQGPGEVLAIIEDPEPRLAADLVDHALVNPGLKLLITFPTDEDTPRPNFVTDQRVRGQRIGALSEDSARQLLHEAGASWDYAFESWVVDQAGGNPGILIAAASSLKADSRRDVGRFAKDVGEGLEKRIRDEFGDGAVRALRLLSLTTFVGTRGQHRQEIADVCDRFGDGLSVAAILDVAERLKKAGIVVQRGSFVEVRPPILANHLAAKEIRGRGEALMQLLGQLKPDAKRRMMQRLRMLESDETVEVARSFCRRDDELFGLQWALANVYLLRFAASVDPVNTVTFIESALQRMSHSERLEIDSDWRRELVYALEDLLLYRETCAAALRSFAWLAEAENESWANNATGILCESFAPLHPQIPLPLDQRLPLLQWLLDICQPLRFRLIGFKAVKEALDETRGVYLRRGSGPRPPDPASRQTLADVFNYLDRVLNMLFEATGDSESELSAAALEAIPMALSGCVSLIPPERLLPRLAEVSDRLLSGEMDVSPSAFADALRMAIQLYDGNADKVKGEEAERWRSAAAGVKGLRLCLDGAPFEIRLKRWAGGWTIDGEDEVAEGTPRILRSDTELASLARETVADPRLLDADLLQWLLSDQAQQAQGFFWHLGRVDENRIWQAPIEELATRVEGQTAFSAYMGGLASTSPEYVSARLDELVADGRVIAPAVINAMRFLGRDPGGVQRVEGLIEQGRVDPGLAARVLQAARWLCNLSADQYVRVLRAVARPDFCNASIVIDMLSLWWHNARPMEGALAEFAWQCLEAARPISHNLHWDHDQLAVRLARDDPSRGFRLLRKLLEQLHENRDVWNPLDRHGGNEFWDALRKVDRQVAYRVVLAVARNNPIAEFHVRWGLSEHIDLAADGETLASLIGDDPTLAILVCRCMSVDRPGFWPFAFEILREHGEDESVRQSLAWAVLMPNGVYWGKLSDRLEGRRQAVEEMLASTETPAHARLWLEELTATAAAMRDRELAQEADEEVKG